MIRELARTGKFGQAGTIVTVKDLQEVAETFSDEAPITLGHDFADWMPAFGWVKSPVVFDAATERLTGDVQPNALLADAEEKELYKKWSLGIRTNAATGKKYIHHLAFLGSMPPKIKGLLKDLQVVNMADTGAAPQAVWTFDDDDQKPQQEKNMPETKTLEQIAAEAAAAAQAKADQEKQSGDMKNLADDLAGAKSKLATLDTQLRQGKITALKTAMAGRIPQAKHADVIALADSLPMQDSIELADDKGVKSKKSPIDLLIDIIGAIAQPVQPGRMNLGDPPAGQGDTVKIDMKKMMAAV